MPGRRKTHLPGLFRAPWLFLPAAGTTKVASRALPQLRTPDFVTRKPIIGNFAEKSSYFHFGSLAYCEGAARSWRGTNHFADISKMVSDSRPLAHETENNQKKHLT